MAREMKIADPGFFQAPGKDIDSAQAERSEKRYRDVRGLFENTDGSLDPDTVMYETAAVMAKETGSGHLNWILTTVHPVLVNGECNMTRGYFRKKEDCEEYYRCEGGRGLLMMEDGNGNCFCEKMSKGSLHRVKGNLARRLINTGNKDLRVVCVANADSGHDHERVEKYPFPFRVFRKNGKILVRER